MTRACVRSSRRRRLPRRRRTRPSATPRRRLVSATNCVVLLPSSSASRTHCSIAWPTSSRALVCRPDASRDRKLVSKAVRVVVAEDEAIIRLDLKEILEEEGYDVVGETGRGDHAIELVRDLKPDL